MTKQFTTTRIYFNKSDMIYNLYFLYFHLLQYTAKWNSGDNPVLVAFGSIMACVVAASIGERIAGN